MWCDGSYGPGKAFAHANRQIDTLLATIQRNPSKIALTTSPSQLKANLRKGKISALIGVEGGHMIEDNLDYLDSLYRRGVRYMTLTWNNSTSWATSAMLESSKGDSLKQKGLTEFGKQVVRRMNELGMIVDVSHVGEQTFWDAINTSTKPVIASHSCAHAICPVFRNLKDDQVKAIARNGGVIHLNFSPALLTAVSCGATRSLWKTQSRARLAAEDCYRSLFRGRLSFSEIRRRSESFAPAAFHAARSSRLYSKAGGR